MKNQFHHVFCWSFITMWPSIKPDEIDVAEDEGWVVRRLVDRSRDHPAGQPRSAKLILSQSITDWWFGMVWNHGIFDVSINIGNVRWTTDFHIFQDGWNHQPVTVDLVEATGKRNMGITEYAAGPVLVFFLTCGVVLSSLPTWTSLNYSLENLPWFEKNDISSNSKFKSLR